MRARSFNNILISIIQSVNPKKDLPSFSSLQLVVCQTFHLISERCIVEKLCRKMRKMISGLLNFGWGSACIPHRPHPITTTTMQMMLF